MGKTPLSKSKLSYKKKKKEEETHKRSQIIYIFQRWVIFILLDLLDLALHCVQTNNPGQINILEASMDLTIKGE